MTNEAEHSFNAYGHYLQKTAKVLAHFSIVLSGQRLLYGMLSSIYIYM